MRQGRLTGAIVAIGLLSFLGIVIETALNIAFPNLMVEFKSSASTVQWLTTGYMLVSTVLIPFGSFLRRRFSAVAIFRVAVISFLLGTICASFAHTFPLLLCGRLLEGIADGLGLPLMFSIILEQAPKAKVGSYMGLGSLVIAFAPAVGPVYGGIVLKYWSWQQLFSFILPIIVLAWLLGEFSIKQVQPVQQVALDICGGCWLAVFLIATLLLVINLTAISKVWLLEIVLVVIALLSLCLFINCEQNRRVKLLNLALFKNKTFIMFLSAFFILQLMSLAMSYLIPNVLQLAFKVTTAQAGLLVLPAAVVDAVVSALAGIIYDRVSHQLPIIWGTVIIVVTLGGANLFVPNEALLVITYIIFMVGLGLSYSNIMTLSLAQLAKPVVNDGNAIFMTAQSYSGAVGTALAASVLSVMQRSAVSTSQGALQGFRMNIIVLTGLAIITFVLGILAIHQLKKV